MQRLEPCQGGWCARRSSCPNHLRPWSPAAADRLCEPGQDGVPKPGVVVMRHGQYQPVTPTVDNYREVPLVPRT